MTILKKSVHEKYQSKLSNKEERENFRPTISRNVYNEWNLQFSGMADNLVQIFVTDIQLFWALRLRC